MRETGRIVGLVAIGLGLCSLLAGTVLCGANRGSARRSFRPRDKNDGFDEDSSEMLPGAEPDAAEIFEDTEVLSSPSVI